MAVTLEAIATPENFDEAGYLAANPDVAEAVRKAISKADGSTSKVMDAGKAASSAFPVRLRISRGTS